jgi:predicted alpha/beta hydrolase family esterase
VPYLLIHGTGGSGPEHWQSWLAERLRARGEEVAFPTLPDPDKPRLDRWLAALRAELARLPLEQTTVVCHSLGSLLWLHYAAGRPREAVARVLLVAPPQPDVDAPESPGFRPTPLDRKGAVEAARETLLVCSLDDPWCPPETSRRIGETIEAPISWLEQAKHVNAESGYGPWPAVEAWALGEPGRPT